MKNSKTKKILSILLAVIMVVGMIPATAIPAYAADEATCPIEGATGTGTEEDPIIVDTSEEFFDAVKYNGELYIQIDANIEVDSGPSIRGTKIITINGKLERLSSYGAFFNLDLNSKGKLILQGTGELITKGMIMDDTCSPADYDWDIVIRGALTFKNNGPQDVPMFSVDANIRVEGGTFIPTTGNDVFYAKSGNNKRVVLAGGSFPNGILNGDLDMSYDTSLISLENGFFCEFSNGTITRKVERGAGSVEIIDSGYRLGFASQSPIMPEGQTETHIGNFNVGDTEAELDISFKANKLTANLIEAGYTLTEETKIINGSKGVIYQQDNGVEYALDNNTPGTYYIYQILNLTGPTGDVTTLQHLFTIDIFSEGVDVEGNGSGTAEDPYRLYTDDDFYDAVSNADSPDIYVKLYDNIVLYNFPTNKWMDIGGSLTIDLNTYDFRMNSSEDSSLPYNCEDWSYTFCGCGNYNNDYYSIRGDFIVKDSADVLGVSIRENGMVTMYDGAISDILMFGDTKGNFIMHNGVCGSVWMTNKTSHSNNIEIYNGRFICDKSYKVGTKLAGVTEQLFLDDVDYSDVTINTFYAADSDGNVSKIDSMSKFADYGKNRLEFAVATPQFAEQSPKMPEGETTTDLGKVQEESYPIYFNAVPLEKEFIDAGYYMYETLLIYNDEYKLVYSTSNNASNGKGIYYDLNNLPDDDYIIIESVALKDKKGKTVLENTNTFEIKWKQQILIDEVNIEVVNPDDQTAYIRGELQTKGVNFDLAKWFLVNTDGTLTENGSKIFVPGNTYRYVVDLGLDEHYVFANGYTVKINGEDASRNEDGTWYKDFVARKKLKPIVEQDTYFFQSGTTREIRVDAHGDGVTYSWTGVSEGAGGYYTVSDYTERVQRLSIPEGAEGTNKYLVRFKDEYGDTAERMITVHITSMGFKEIKPTPTAEQFEAGVTDYGYVFPGEDGSGVPKVYFEAYELSQGYIDEGYTMETSLIDYVDGVKVGEGQEAWEYTTYLPGAHEIVQKIVIKDSEGNVFKEYTYTHKMNVMREIALNTVAYGSALYGYRVEVYQDGKLASEQTNGNNITMDVIAPVGDVKIVVSKNSYKAREYEATIPADGFFSLNTEILRWGDANLDDVLDVQDYQQTINKGLSDNHKLDGSYEQSVMDWAEDGYIDVIDCYFCVLCINGADLFSASVEYDKYYGTGGETIKIPVTAEGFGVTYEWKAPEDAPAIVDGSEDEATVKICIEPGKYNIGDKFTYTCIVRDMFFSYAELEVELEIEHLTNLYAVTYSSQYEDVKGLPGKTRVKAGESITIPELIPQLDGYTFMYWYAGSDRLNPGDTYTPYQNTIIMPYMAKDYTITLHSGIGGEIFETHKGNYGHYYYLPEMDELSDGYIFYGWTDVEGSTEVKYTTGYRYEIKGDADLYPVIAKASDVKLTIYANDGTDQVIYETTLAEQNGALYFTIPEDLEMPTREGYVCTGFITSSDGYYYGVDKYWQGSNVAANPAGVVLYAHWELPNVLQFKGGMDGVTGLPDSVSFESPQSYQITSWLTPYCDGYEFLYWEDEEGNQYRPEDYVVVQGITTLTAVWEKLDTENYEIWISGQKVSKANPVVQCGTGTARVVEDEWGNVTLVLDDAQITGDEGIRTEYSSLSIEVYGENTITVSGDNARGITGPNGNITITGPGTLNVDVKGDNSIGIKGLYSVEYATVNVNAETETDFGVAYGVSCLSGSQYRITIDNGATLNATATTYGIYNAGELRVSKNSKVVADGDVYGIYSIYGIYDGWGGSSFGTVIASGGTGAMTTASSNYLHNYGLDSYDVKLSTMQSGLIKTDWDRYEEFCDNTTEYGYKYVEIKPTACTGEHTYTTYSGLEATCDKDGLTDGEYCYTCGYVKTEREYIEAEGHDYHTHNGKAATCTEQGIKGSYTQCDNCGEYKGNVTFIDATGHSWGEWILIDGTDIWYDEYGYGEREYIRYCYNCDEYERTWYTYEDPNDTGSPNDWESGGVGPAG